MRKNTFIKKALIAVMFLLNIISYSQNLKPFTPRFDQDVRGDMFLIGNNTLNRDTNSTNPNDPYNGGGVNGDFDMRFIDIDSDASTFSSSSATLASPRGVGDNCYKIIYAGLYWGATLQSGSRTDINKVKFKLPTGGYINITGQIIHDANPTPIGDDNMRPYACYADVTNLIVPLANPVGTYTVANVLASQGDYLGTGNSAGWSLFIVYEDPTLTSKSIVSFDGFSAIGGAGNLSFLVDGFRTIPTGPVRAKFAMTALEGDQQYTGDYLRINGTPINQTNAVPVTLRPANNFFNSSITDVNGYMNAAAQRTPNSTNTLGYDAAVLNIANGGNTIIANNATSATIQLGSTQDVYFYFFNAFAVDIIAPDILLTKTVENDLGTPIGGTPVNLGQSLNYEIGFANVGNDPATSFTIRDVLPVNVIFNYPADLNMTFAPPGTTHTYNPATRTLVFTIPNDLPPTVDTQQYHIGIHVQVVSTCLEMDDACSNLIQNQAFATYSGTSNTGIFSDEGSIASFGNCGLGTPGSTNFLVGLDNCNFTRTEVLCGGSIVLTAANGYQTYTWSGPGTITPVPGTNNQSVTISQPGTYTVNDIINLSPCKSIVETINVVSFGNTVTNPVIPVADHIAICPNDLKELPFIFLCGAGDSQLIQTNIVDALSFSWERLVGCTVTTTNPNCANDDASCTWTPVGSAPNFTASAAGEYRIVINFQGGCQRIFYFNVFQNLLAPTVTTRDIICGTPGQITVNNVPPGYLYSLTPAGNPPGTWGTGNVFTINTAGVYTVHIQQSGVVGGCIFTVPNIPIQSRNLTVTPTLTQPLCFGEKGSIALVANGVDPQYTFTINQGATTIDSVGPIVSNSHTFSNLNPGNYSYTVTTQSGCTITGNFTINNPSSLSASVALTLPLTPCSDGEITVYPVGGTPPYYYFINSTTVFQSVPQYVVTAPGVYNIHVVDSNNCFVDTSITVTNNPPPVFTVTQTNVLCYGNNSGAINFNVTNPNGYTLGYSITGAAPFTTNPSFTNLLPGTYTAVIQYTLGGAVCLTPPQTITITQPATALTASGGVAAVACASNGGNGIVRITNVQGGTPYPAPNFYQYNFGAGYQNLNQANLPPGTYTIYVRDANLCEFPMTVTLDPIPPDPTITVGAPTFSCSGSATSTVTVNNGASSYTYQYFIDVPLTPPHDPNSNVFNNVPCGPHVVTVNYTLVSPSTFSNLLREDFGVGGNTTTPGIAAAYCFHDQTIFPTPCIPTNNPRIEDNAYAVTSAINPNNPAWYPYRDHTTNGTNPNARFLAINIGSAAGPYGVLYSKQINDVIPNQPVIVDLYLANLLNAGVAGADPDFILELVNSSGTVVGTQSTGVIDNVTNGWQLKSLSLNPGNNTTLTFKIRSGSILYSGNDALIDDISVYQLPVSCLATRNFPINIACNQAFSAQITGHQDVTCAGLNNGTITLAAQNFNAVNGFQVSMNNGTTWTTYFTSPVTIPVPAAYPGFVLVRFDATPGNAACSLNLPQIIVTPTPLVPSASSTPATCSAGSTITAAASGGTPAYQYQLTNSGGTVIVAYQSSPIFTNIAPGSYIVIVRDVNLCSASTPITIAGPVAPTATISPTSDFCYDGTNAATIVVTPAGGVPPYTYTINGNPNPNNTFGPLTPGNYTIIVRDSYGCSVTLPVQTINAQLTVTTSLIKDLDCTASPNATITGTIAGGYPGYTCVVNGTTSVPVTGSTFTYSAATAGTYQFVVTDTRGCTAQSSVITINPLVPISATNAVTNVTCNGLSNGSVTITPSGGAPGYQINFNNTGFSASTTYSNLAAGTYTYIVRDIKNCTFNGSVSITAPSAITGTATLTTQYTCTTSGLITVGGVSGGTAPYSYSINGVNFFPGNTFTITAPGSYIITIRDTNGCTFTCPAVIVAPLNPPTDLSFSATALTCPSNTSNVTLTVTGSNPPYTYQAVGPGPIIAVQGSNLFNNLAPNTYTFLVTDAKNCTYQESFTITPLAPVTVVGQLINNVQCFGTSTGSIRFTIGGFSPNYSYVITGPVGSSGTAQTAPVINVTSLPAGTYTIVVTNPTTNCTATTSVTINQPASALTSSIVVSPITCLTNGQVVVTASGGWGGNIYTISPVVGTQSGNTFSNLPVGTYTVTTTDSGGCAVTNTFTLTGTTSPTATISAASDFCYDATNGATIVVTPAGGIAPYSYTINGNPNPNNTFGPLTPGTYTIVVTDSFGCSVTLPVQTINPQLTLTTVLTKELDCTASPNAVITGTIAGGYPGYTCVVNGVTPVTVTGNTFTYSTSVAGNYQFLVTDTRGCTVQSGVITINPLIPVAATHTQVNNTCFGATAGSVTITPSGGTAPYQINFNGIGFSSTTTYTGLAAGTYNYIVRDSKNCTFNGSVTITQPAEIIYTAVVNPISCNAIGGYTLGSICVNGLSGGIAPYTYTLVDLTGGTTNQVHVEPAGANYCFPNIDFGIYDLIVTDANGCTIVKSNLIISNPPNDLTFVITPTIPSCAAGATVTVTVVSIGVGPYEFGIVNAAAPIYSTNFVPANTPPFTHVFTGLTPGAIYTIVVRDVTTGCYYFEQMTAATPTNSTMSVTSLVANPVACRGAADGSVTFSLSGYNAGATSISYSINYASNNIPVGTPGTFGTISPIVFPVTAGPLAPGTYNIQFTENGGANSGCGTTSATFTITQSATDLTLTATTTNDNCNLNAGRIAPVVNGGTGPYTYQYINPSGGPLGAWVTTNPYNAESGTYDVYVRDANGCIRMVTVTVNSDPTPVVAAAIANACAAQGNFAINVTLPTTGVAPYTYSIDGGAYQALTAPFTISGLSSGPHSVQVRDANGCGNTVNLNILTPVTVSAAFTTQPTCLNNDGTITVTATGGSGNYTYTLLTSASVIITGPQASNVFAGQPAGNYIVRVTDTTTSCNTEIPFSLIAPTPVTFTAVTQSVTCLGDSNGTITINLAAGNNNPPYTYQITAPIVVGPQASNIFTGLAAGTYTVQVSSGRGCTLVNNNVIVGTPTAVVASGSATAFTCAADNSVNTSTITVNGTGGTPGYTYSINGVNYLATNTFNVIDNGAVQNITVYVRDANGCIDTEVVVVNPLQALVSATVVQDIAITCTNPEQVHINVVGGSGNFTYQLLPLVGVPQASNIFSLPAPGNYFFQVNDVTTGCYIATAVYTVAPFNTINVAAAATTAVTCFGNSNGAISINVTGYSGAYSYNVLDSANAVIASGVGNTSTNPLAIAGLPAGNYTIQVTETASPFCVFVSNVATVTSPSAPVALAITSNINANCNIGAQVTVIGSGGTPNYTYAFVQDGVAPVPGDYSASNTAVLLPSTNTQWDVHVLDANNCHTQIDVTIATDPLPTITLPAFAADQCTSAGTSYTFTATGTGIGTLTYSVGTGFQASPTFTVSAPGTYTVTIRDGNGCTANASIVIYAPLGLSSSITALPSCANNDGVVTVTAAGGSGNYVYSIAPIVGTQAINVFSNLPSGSYTITVRDVTTNCTYDLPVNISAATPVTFNTTVNAVTCFGGSDGIITVNLLPGNDNPLYTYEITAPIIVGPQSSNIFAGLAAGTYTVQVNSGRGCSATQSVIVNEAPIVTVPAATVIQFACNAGTNATNFATITVTGVTGGSGVYTNYEFILGGVTLQSGASNTFTATNLAGGTYTINAYDANGCIGTTTAIINPFIGISNPMVTVTSPVTCITPESISVSVTTTGGSPVLTYTINSIPAGFTQTNNTGIFTGLIIGDYLINVTNPITNCSVETIHYVFDPNTFILNVAPVSDVICVGGTEGSVSLTIVDNDLTPTNDAGPFSYVVVNNNTGLTINGNSATAGPTVVNGLTAGVYTATVTLTNNPTCPVSSNFTIVEPSVALNVTATNTAITCNPGLDGSITATATGGWGGPYEFELVGPVTTIPYSTSNVFSGLGAGNYTVNVRDAKLCIDSFNVTLSVPTVILVSIIPSTTSVSCFGDTSASISISYPTGGQGSNYTYTLNTILPTPSSSGPIAMPLGGAVITGLGAGTYNVTIQDGFGCVSPPMANIVIGQPGKLVATLSTLVAETCNADTVIRLTATGGTAPFTYSADGITYSVATFDPFVDINIPAGSTGTFAYYIKDANGCISAISNPITTIPPAPVVITVVNQTDILCGGPTGALSVTAQGGLGNYVYTLVDAVGTPIVAGSQVLPGQFTNLPAGTYYVLVTTNGGCNTTAGPFTFTNPPAFVISAPVTTPVKCASGADGTITITVSGGVPPYYYFVSPINSQTMPLNGNVLTVSNLVAGLYDVTIQDSNGCIQQALAVSIVEPQALSTGISTHTDVSCTELADGTITITGIAGGVAPYFATSNYITHYDNSVNPPLLVDDSVYVPVNGAGGTSHVFSNLAGGTYPIAIKDTNGCVILDVIDVAPGVLYTPAIESDIHCIDVAGVSTQYVELTAVNTNNLPSGTFPAGGGFLFSLDVDNIAVAQLSPTFNSINFPSLLTPGTHIIYVYTSSGCYKETPPFTINATDIDPLVLILQQGGLNEIIANTNNALGQPSGTPPYTFTFNGHNNGSDNTYVYTQSGNYHVTVTDSKGCFAEATQPFTFVPIFIPNVFTPDGNGGNDLWGPTNTANYKDLTTDIFDRYGRKVKELKEGEFWDGKYNGNELPSGDYWYVIKVDGNNDKEYVGHFTLYR